MGQVGMETDLLPLDDAEGAGLVPDPVLHTDSAQVVDEPGPPHGLAGVGVEPCVLSRRTGELGDSVRVSPRPR